ncbi:MAG: hypothetical protein AABX01_05210 [Candidatus Micrarchaeota archaeon]
MPKVLYHLQVKRAMSPWRWSQLTEMVRLSMAIEHAGKDYLNAATYHLSKVPRNPMSLVKSHDELVKHVSRAIGYHWDMATETSTGPNVGANRGDLETALKLLGGLQTLREMKFIPER